MPCSSLGLRLLLLEPPAPGPLGKRDNHSPSCRPLLQLGKSNHSPSCRPLLQLGKSNQGLKMCLTAVVREPLE
jgi:hypothetical protein